MPHQKPVLLCSPYFAEWNPIFHGACVKYCYSLNASLPWEMERRSPSCVSLLYSDLFTLQILQPPFWINFYLDFRETNEVAFLLDLRLTPLVASS